MLATQSGLRRGSNQPFGHEHAACALRQARYLAEALPSIAGVEARCLKADRVQHGCDTPAPLSLFFESSQNGGPETATPVLGSYVKKVKKEQSEGRSADRSSYNCAGGRMLGQDRQRKPVSIPGHFVIECVKATADSASRVGGDGICNDNAGIIHCPKSLLIAWR
jgi:hypothetical protein